MRTLAALIVFLATPASAHHEVAVATSMAPMLGVLAPVAFAAMAIVRKRLRRQKQS